MSERWNVKKNKRKFSIPEKQSPYLGGFDLSRCRVAQFQGGLTVVMQAQSTEEALKQTAKWLPPGAKPGDWWFVTMCLVLPKGSKMDKLLADGPFTREQAEQEAERRFQEFTTNAREGLDPDLEIYIGSKL
jgi:hypothetical protein